MLTLPQSSIPVYELEPDDIAANRDFRMYNYEGTLPNQADLLIPHRKSYYLLVFIKHGDSTRHWVDMTPHLLKDNTIYFTDSSQVIVKEEFKHLWSTGIAFTKAFLALPENAAISSLPLVQNPHSGFELLLTPADVHFVEDLLASIHTEYVRPGEWQGRMLSAWLTVLLTHLSRLYTAQYRATTPSVDKALLKQFQEKVNECFREWHQVGNYAAHLHLSAGHLSDVVKAQSGKPAIKHIHDRLVMEARRLLFHTPQSLKEVAFDFGFADASYFTRFFKRETGTTPALYREAIRKMYQ